MIEYCTLTVRGGDSNTYIERSCINKHYGNHKWTITVIYRYIRLCLFIVYMYASMAVLSPPMGSSRIGSIDMISYIYYILCQCIPGISRHTIHRYHRSRCRTCLVDDKCIRTEIDDKDMQQKLGKKLFFCGIKWIISVDPW